MNTEQFWRDAERHVVRYGASFVPRIIKRANGSYVYDEDGTAILDFTSGQMSSVLGHSHPDVVATVSTAVATLDHLYSGMLSGPWWNSPNARGDAARAAEQGSAAHHRRRVQRGGDQDGQALHRQVRGRFVRPVLARHDVGRSVGDVQRRAARLRTADAGQSHAADAERLPVAVPACRRHLRLAVRARVRVRDRSTRSPSGSLAACLIEPILSSGGIIEPPPGYLRRLKELCVERDMLLIVDEAQTGIGRTGLMYAFERDGIVPDLLTLSKTLGAGLPVAAVVTSDEHRKRLSRTRFPVLHHPRLGSARRSRRLDRPHRRRTGRLVDRAASSATARGRG